MNNAAIPVKGASWKDLDNWHKCFEVNLFGCVIYRDSLGIVLTVDTRAQSAERAAHVRP